MIYKKQEKVGHVFTNQIVSNIIAGAPLIKLLSSPLINFKL